MNQLERNQNILKKYIPEKAVPVVAQWIYQFDFKLRVKKSRSSKYGDYRPPIKGENHLITINYDLNTYAFLVTLVHEIAHLVNFNENRNKVKPHGAEWKIHYKKLMQHFIQAEVFPEDISNELNRYLDKPTASSCSDIDLLRVLKKYDKNTSTVLLEEIPDGHPFIYGGQRAFVKGEKLRKRFKCRELSTNHEYFFNPLTEVIVPEAIEI